MKAKLIIAIVLSLCLSSLMAGDLSSQFAKPPASARPWVCWFLNNGNVTKAGITTDLEAPPCAGIGGVIIMDRVERLAQPPGMADFMNAEWQELFPASGKQETETWLDPGEMPVMAQVKLNGQDSGVLWKPPFRVDVTNAPQSGRNTLEIRGADLWLNRMIGDSALPTTERFSWSSFKPFTQNTPLPKSGLIGPVTIRTAEVIPPSTAN